MIETPHYERLRPPAALSDAIAYFWRLLMPMVIAPDEIISAEGQAEILFQFHGQSQVLPHDSDEPFECASSWLMRPFAQALHVRQVGVTRSAMIGVRFTPGGWAAFHHNDTTDKQPYSFMPLDTFYPPLEIRLLEEQLYSLLVTPQWTQPLIAFFAQRRVEPTHLDRMMYAAGQLERRQVSIPTLAQEVSLSDRQFGRLFRQIIGLSPKQFSRIARLNRVLGAQGGPLHDMPLEQLAPRYGYHDPSHLVREFQALVGMSPVEYFSSTHDLIDQKFRDDGRFLQWELDMMSVLSST